MTSPLRRKHRTTALNTRGWKTADRSRSFAPFARIACAALAAILFCSASLRAGDDQSAQSQATADQSSNSAQDTADAIHATRLKWRPYRAHDAQSSDVASSDDGAVFSDAAPIGGRQPPRIVHDSAIVQAEATAPAASPFGDDANQPVAQISTQPAPAAQLAPGQFAPSTNGPNVGPQNAPYNLQPVGPAPLNTPGPNASSDAEDLSCATHTVKCEKDEAALRDNTINKIGLDIHEYGKEGDTIPCECTIGTNVRFDPRQWCMITYTWKAAALCHKPLYFEEVQLERYGHSAGPIVEPLLSAAHFFITVPLLPYYMGVDPPLECQYTLGYYRPGDCAPYMLDPFPLSVRGAVLEAGAVVGVTSVIP